MPRTNGQEVIPSAKRLIRSLRDMGYDFPTAVADLIDNSIEAGATRVEIDVEFEGDNSWVRIADNGFGMDLPQLQEAMRYGSEREYDTEKDLGKFGLGLKTASMSQCQRLSVASRSDPEDRVIHAYCWDLEHVDATNKWEIVKVDRNGLKLMLDGHLADSTGTVVFWQRLDRILGYRHPYGEKAKTRLATMCREVEEHLAMVFHRFLAGEVPGKKLVITLNGIKIKPWDPFARNETKTQCQDTIPIRLEYEGTLGTVTLAPYVLPAQIDFSSRDEFNRASGPRKWNRQQGFYIYRANRLIQSGGWSGLRTVDEHTKLARVALSFSPHLDEAFKINVSKMRVQLPAQIRDQIEIVTRPVVKLAQDTYRKSGQKPTTNSSGGATAQPVPPSTPPPTPGTNLPPSDTTTQPNPVGTPETPKRLWTLDEIQAGLENAAEPQEKPIISGVFTKFRKKLNS